jgi:hypothetical protein
MAAKFLKQHRDQLRKERLSRKKDKDNESGKAGPKTTVVIENPYKEFGDEKAKMYARGWGYIPKGKAPQHQWMETICGSMTTSGAAALMICKASLEGTSLYNRFKKKMNQGVRDGCAWIAKNFSVTANPGRGGYHFYFLYGMERVGVLTLCPAFGEHKWYEEGANYLLGHQSGNGCWSGGGESDLVNTCFALLFLKRATTPIVDIPEDIGTGSDLFGPGKKPGNK